MPPLVRIGVVGLDRRGLFQLERWQGDSEIRIVAACDGNPLRRQAATSLCERVTDEFTTLLDDDRIAVVVVDVPAPQRAAIAASAIAAGKHVLFLEPCLAESTGEVRRLFDAAAATGTKLIVEADGRNDADFRAALAVARSSAAGPLRFLRFERWAAAGFESDATSADGTSLRRALAFRLDEAVVLADRSPVRVCTFLSEGGITAFVEFDGGVAANVGLRTNASALVESGWMLDAAHGGYADGRRWVRTRDGEVYNVPVEPMTKPSLKERLLEVLRGDGPPLSRLASLRVAALMTGVDESLRTGRAVDVESTES